jgi:hypothetical protein
MSTATATRTSAKSGSTKAANATRADSKTTTKPAPAPDAKAQLQTLRDAANPDGDHDPTTPALPIGQRNAMETLPEGHTYRDRVEAQARACGVGFTADTTTEYLMFLIRMKTSS